MLGFKATSTLYSLHMDYSKDTSLYHIDSGRYTSNYFNLEFFTNLIKKYDSLSHVINVNVDYTIPGYEDESGYLNYLVNLTKKTENLHFSLAQFFYNESGFNFLEHRINEIYNFSDYKYKYSDLENEIVFHIDSRLNVYNNVKYSFEDSELSKFQTGFEYGDERFYTSISHTYQKNGDSSSGDDINFISARVDFNLNQNYTISGEYDYDFDKDFNRLYRVALNSKFGCWGYKISYKELVQPSLSSYGTTYSKKRGFYIEFNLASIGGIKQEISNDSDKLFARR
jgi:LPS-assembly protein